jgi:hypothetical protein
MADGAPVTANSWVVDAILIIAGGRCRHQLNAFDALTERLTLW